MCGQLQANNGGKQENQVERGRGSKFSRRVEDLVVSVKCLTDYGSCFGMLTCKIIGNRRIWKQLKITQRDDQQIERIGCGRQTSSFQAR